MHHGFVNVEGKAVIGVEKSRNEKVGEISITYASQATCPNTCPLRGAGCYAELGRMGMITSKLNLSTATPLEAAREEARVIRELAKVSIRPLRLHGVGDCSTEEAARIVSEACEEYKGEKYTYTHAWETVPREAWGSVSVLASCENLEQADDAMKRGYAVAMVVPEHDGPRPYKVGGLTIQPCPQQTTPGVTCNSCRMCMNDKKLLERKKIIAFAAHGQRKRLVRQLVGGEM